MKQPSLGTVFQVLVLTTFNCGSILVVSQDCIAL